MEYYSKRIRLEPFLLEDALPFNIWQFVPSFVLILYILLQNYKVPH